MRDYNHQRTIVGVLGLLSIGLAFGLTMLLSGDISIFDNRYDVNVQFIEGVDGITIGQPVTLNGKRVGETKKIDFWDPEDVTKGIRITVAIEQEYNIPSNAKVEVAPGLIQFGRPPIRIAVPKEIHAAEALPKNGTAKLAGGVVSMPEQVLPKETQDRIFRVADEVADLAVALRPVARNLELLLEPRSTEDVDVRELNATLATVIDRFDSSLKNVNSVIADEQNIANLRETLANAREMSERGVEAMAKMRDVSARSEQVVVNASKLLSGMTETIDQMSSVLTKMDAAFASINDRKGTIGALLNDNRLYEELLLSARRLTKALDDVREVLDIAKRGELRIKAF